MKEREKKEPLVECIMLLSFTNSMLVYTLTLNQICRWVKCKKKASPNRKKQKKYRNSQRQLVKSKSFVAGPLAAVSGFCTTILQLATLNGKLSPLVAASVTLNHLQFERKQFFRV